MPLVPEIQARGAGSCLHQQQPLFSERRTASTRGRAVRWPREAPTMPPSPSGPPSLPPGLLDNGVHGRNVLRHDEGLAVGHVVQRGPRVARQDDLRQTTRAFEGLGHHLALSRAACPPTRSCTAPDACCCLAAWMQMARSTGSGWPEPRDARAGPPPCCTYLPCPEEQRQPHREQRSWARVPRAAPTLTSVPLDRSALTKGKTPKMTSTPLLSAKIKAHL